MKKTPLLILLLFCSLLLKAQTERLTGVLGDGSETHPYQIGTPEHLSALAQWVNAGNGASTKGKHYRIMNDMDLTTFLSDSTAGWLPIGTNGNSFQGSLHGGGHVISGLRINQPNLGDCGLFGSINAAHIDSLGIEVAENDSVCGQDATGILAGRATNFAKISQCYVKGNVVGGANVGGFVGRFNNSYLENCYANVKVKSVNAVWSFAGGLVGFNYNSEPETTGIKYSYATGNVVSMGDYAGGLAGYGRNTQGFSRDYIRNCVAANHSIQGNLVGKIGYTYVEKCYAWDAMETSDNEGISGVHATLEQFQNQNFYTNVENWQDAVWNFEEIWMMPSENSLPVFRWQNIPIDIVEPIVTVNGNVVERVENTFTLNLDCGIDTAEIAIEAGVAKIILNDTLQNTYQWYLPDYGDNHLPFTLIWQNGDTVQYHIVTNKAIPFEQIVSTHWNNTLTVINNPENNGGYTFTSYKWYRNGEFFSNKQWWSAGPNGEQLNAADQYRVELTAVEKSGILRTCESSIILKTIDFSAYPNPVSQGETLYIHLKSAEESLKDAVIEVYSSNGKWIETRRASAQIAIDAKYTTGVYILVLKGENELRKELKVVVQ